MPMKAPKSKPATQVCDAAGWVDFALAAADAARIVAQHVEAALHEQVIHLHRDRVVHVAAGARVRRQDQGDGSGVVLARRVARFNAAGAAGKDDVGHVCRL
jgi:hypothetical protein